MAVVLDVSCFSIQAYKTNVYFISIYFSIKQFAFQINQTILNFIRVYTAKQLIDLFIFHNFLNRFLNIFSPLLNGLVAGGHPEQYLAQCLEWFWFILW